MKIQMFFFYASFARTLKIIHDTLRSQNRGMEVIVVHFKDVIFLNHIKTFVRHENVRQVSNNRTWRSFKG